MTTKIMLRNRGFGKMIAPPLYANSGVDKEKKMKLIAKVIRYMPKKLRIYLFDFFIGKRTGYPEICDLAEIAGFVVARNIGPERQD